MTERTPLVGGGGSINSTGGGSSFLATINDADEDLLGVESGDSVGKGHEENTKNELGVSLFFFYFPPSHATLFSPPPPTTLRGSHGGRGRTKCACDPPSCLRVREL